MRTPKHGIRGKLESWSSKKYRAAKSITPFIELGMAAYFVVAMTSRSTTATTSSMPFLGLFLCRLRLRRLGIALAGRRRRRDARALDRPRAATSPWWRPGLPGRHRLRATDSSPGEMVIDETPEPRRSQALR